MICCKIIADYKQQSLQFGDIFMELNKIGSVLWNNGCLYFANTVDLKIGDKNIKKIFKKYGCNEIFVQKYDNSFCPESDNYVDWWIENKLIEMSKVELENNQQEIMQHISQQLTDLSNLLEQHKQNK